MKRTASFIVAILVCLLVRTAWADMIYVTVDGVPGSVTTKGHEKSILATGFNFQVDKPTSGLPSGQRKSTFNLTLNVNASTPELYQFTSTNHNISTVDVEIVAPIAGASGTEGRERTLLTFKLKNATIAKMEIHTDPSKPLAQSTTPVVDLTLDAEAVTIEVAEQDKAAGTSPAPKETTDKGAVAPKEPTEKGGVTPKPNPQP